MVLFIFKHIKHKKLFIKHTCKIEPSNTEDWNTVRLSASQLLMAGARLSNRARRSKNAVKIRRFKFHLIVPANGDLVTKVHIQ